ncbi:NAD-dependent dihydropyrimidine dehydrogenase subunit PreA [Candidatus Desulfarcum epimagneticum]|uniref:dihydrouracil dehydrogenase (NAD(+)) n=1 Tax=uncultured Desulfobacteraceae bacterium TaxID=218296 RepID=A0A484HIB9_9BACT|nr:NAD-dependent dihydropyrimidine dehydrogenase subunit PreA [uncultured Desulfobacteraceae bacterium]
MPNPIDLSVEFCGKRFENPFLLSSSPVSNSAEMTARAFEAGWGGAVFKTMHADGAPIVHPSPRMNAYHYQNSRLAGLQNVEQVSDRPLKDNLLEILYLKKKYTQKVLIASLMGFSNPEWEFLARSAEDNGADMLELNFSCPHMCVEGSGYKVGQAFGLIETFTETVKKKTSIPVMAKMTPNITDITEPALFAKKGGANAISAINTVRGISEIGLDDFVPRPNVAGMGAISGASGPIIKPLGLRFIAELAQCRDLSLPLSGIGGIETWIDALEYLLLGASTIQVTTGVIHYGYRIVSDMIEGLSDFMAQKKIARVTDLVGKALPHLHETGRFDLEKQGVARYNMDHCVGCGQCFRVCRDAGGQALDWDRDSRRPVPIEEKCLSCMICAFVCPAPGVISFHPMPAGWERRKTPVMDPGLEGEIRLQHIYSNKTNS